MERREALQQLAALGAASTTRLDNIGAAASVAGSSQQVGSIRELLTLKPVTAGMTVHVASYWHDWSATDSPRGGGLFIWTPAMPKSNHDGGVIISPTVPWDGSVTGHARFNGVFAGDRELPVGTKHDDFAYKAQHNPTDIKNRLPIMGGFLGGEGETMAQGLGCWVRANRYNAYSFCNFGARGNASANIDGTDDSYAMLQAIRSVPKTSGLLTIEPLYYTHGNGDERVILLYMEGYNQLTINGYGAVIQSHRQNPALVANAGFWWVRCKNLTVNGLTFDGRLDVRTPIVSDPNQTNKQHGFNIGLDCEHVTLNDCIAKRCLMDGFFVGGSGYTADNGDYLSPGRITLNNCISEYNYRQGLSISRCQGLSVIGGSYSHTGRLGQDKGTSPMAGIDSESEGVARGNNNYGLLIDGVSMVNNRGAGLSFSLGSVKSVARGCYIANNGAGGILCTQTSYGCTIEGSFLQNNGSELRSEGCEILNLGYQNTYRSNHLKPSTKAILDLALIGARTAGDGSVYDDNIIDNSANIAHAGFITINQARLYTNNRHINLQSAIDGYAVNINAANCLVMGNEGINNHADNPYSFMRINQALQVRDNRVKGYQTTNTSQIYIRPAALGGKVQAYGPNFDDDADTGNYSMGSQLGGVDYPPVLHAGRRIGSMTAAPVAGDWQQGDVIFRSNISTSNVLTSNSYWICAASGSFAAINATGDTSAGSKIISAVSNLTNLNVGGFISIVEAGISSSRINRLDAKTGTISLDKNATATVKGAALSTTAPVFLARDYQSVKGASTGRPKLALADAGYLYFDTSLTVAGKPIWWTGVAWVDANGAVV